LTRTSSRTSTERATIRAFLATQSTLALATADAEGNPQVAPLFYWSDDDLNLYWLSAETSRHSLNLARHALVAATIYPSVWEWTAIRGLQIEGQASVVSDSTRRDTILAAYKAKFSLPAAFDEQITVSSLYVLKPTWLRWLDNGVKFGYKAEYRLGGDDP
jgi:uncharacterized protein YhbP (UPF0306 family)